MLTGKEDVNKDAKKGIAGHLTMIMQYLFILLYFACAAEAAALSFFPNSLRNP